MYANNDTIISCNEYIYLGPTFDATGKDNSENKKRVAQTRRTRGINGTLWS